MQDARRFIENVFDSKSTLKHSIRVGEMGQRPDEVVVGYLHDYFEDVPSSSWLRLGAFVKLSDEQIDALNLLTRGEETYDEYILNILEGGNRLAHVVKIYDLLDHLNPNTGRIPEKKIAKYTRHLNTLLAEYHNAY